MFVFEDIVTMDERSVQRFLRDCDPKDLVLALKGANSEVSNKIFQNMSTRMAQSIRDDLEITTTSACAMWRRPSSASWGSSGIWRRKTS